MQERIHGMDDDFFDIVLQYHPEHMTLGIGMKPRTDIPQKHFVDKIYGEVPTQTEIGRIFHSRVNDLGWDMREFNDSDSEADFHNKLGRAILDAVTGSTYADGMFTWLDRPGSNKLIRLTRKGRDVSFGRDE